MFESPIATMFGTVGIIYGVLLPLFLLVLLTLSLVAGLQNPGAKPLNVAKATANCLAMAVGVLLMTIAAIPAGASVLSNTAYPSSAYIALLLIFAAGGGLLMHQEQKLKELDSASRSIPFAVFITTIRLIGILASTLAGLSFVLTLVLGGSDEPIWWVMPLTVFFYGLILNWCTQSAGLPKWVDYLMNPPKPAVKKAPPVKVAVKPVAKKASKPAAKKATKKKKAPARPNSSSGRTKKKIVKKAVKRKSAVKRKK